jgi:glycosyltransferase involved in cell wall biosynthesis
MSRPSISLVVIARNEESLIGQCLQSARFCDELVLVDSFSTDGTVDVAKAHGAKVFSRNFQGYIDQKQFALEQATGDWVLSLDADEQATFELQREILAQLESEPADGYEIRRILYHLGHYYTRAIYPDYHLRLFRRMKASFGGREPHAKVVLNGSVARLKSPILHFSYRDIADHVATMNRLSSQAANAAENGALIPLKMIANPAWRFFNFYVLRGGFRDGGRGLYASMAAAFYVFLKYAKIYESRLNSRRTDVKQ